jgi:hypothetical protein
MMMVIAFGSQTSWSLSQWDADSAYLQSEGLDRALLLRMPDPAPPGHQPGDIVVATGAIYGTKDAGRQWYLHLKKTMAELGVAECVLEKGLYRLYHNGAVRMVIHTHVDDLLVAMDTSSTHAKEVLQKMKASLHLKGSDGRSFVYLARNFTITDEKITISQSKAAANLEMVFVDKERRSHPNAPLVPEEKSEYRSIIGSLAWLAQQTRLDIAVAVNKLAQRIEKAEVQDLLQANAVVRMVQRSVDRAIVIRRGIFDPKDLALIGFGDASFATSEELKSQAGELLIATKPKDINKVRDGAYDKGVLLSYRTATVKRVVRSTLSSEGYAISETAELLEWTRYVRHRLERCAGTR